MKQLWLVVVLLAAGIFAWQAYRLKPVPEVVVNTPVANTSPAAVSEPATPPVEAEPPLVTTPQTHVVVAGDSLHGIGLKYNLRWSSIAALNGLSEETPIVEGSTLLLPITVSGHIIEIREVSIDNITAQNAQNDARFANITWRLDPIEVTRQTAPTDAGILHDTALSLESRDDELGQAVVVATVDGRLKRIFLTQPITKGPTGVWFVTRTEVYRWQN